MQKLTLIFSDTEFGEGNATDDFVEDELFIETISKNFHYGKEYPIDFVFNGDTFDFLKAPYKGKYLRHITEKISLWKLEEIQKAHPLFFITLTECLKTNKQSRIIFIHGNHDFDIEFAGVQKKIKEMITKEKEEQKKILFPGFEFSDGILHIEHGSQLDEFFRVEPDKLVYDSPNQIVGEPFLLSPWGYNAIYEHYIAIKEEFPIIERLNPRARTIELLPFKLKKRILGGTVWYLLKVFFWTQWKHKEDPLYHFTLPEFKKYMYNFFKGEYEIKVDRHAKRKLKKNGFKAICFGHTHRAKIWKIKDKWMLNTGNWRDEYQLNEKEKMYYPKTKSYAFIIHNEKDIQKIELKQLKSKQNPISIKELKDYARKKSIIKHR
ncbi:MAG TPA: hypothetical protein HA360_02985 [Nanoarchaeota archaeon]|nr:metallophosphoesterase [Candidatus Woesearchaeota archaeon]HIH14847.1 hypothetical protein [Nanoarchaeota archaeon]HIH58894.1 hypothetical protein [Nanoarchaeota archaeon]HII14016.1 hypothetical protein [Nanoarchaeota archaeon]HIJ05250.1 hypothetical protein [Nanoarchaeota archaeon]